MAVTQLDGSRQLRFTGDLDLQNQKITNLAAPSASGDVANKSYVDSVATGLLQFKQSVEAASTANVSVSSAPTTIDGITLASGNRVLLKNQSNAVQNGVYVFTAAASPLTRSTDTDADAEVTSGMFLFVEGGTVNGQSGWILSTPDPVEVGTTELTFVKFSATNQNSTTLAGAGLVANGNAVDVGATNGTITVDADGISVATGGIANNEISSSAAIALSKLANGSSAQVIVASSGGVPTYVDITGDITTTNAGVTTIGAGAVSNGKLASDAVTNVKVASNAAIALSKLAAGTSAQVIVADGSGVPTYVAISGDVTTTNAGVVTIGTGAVCNSIRS